MTRKIVVTGGRGFLGSWIVAHFAKYSATAVLSVDTSVISNSDSQLEAVDQVVLDVLDMPRLRKVAEDADVIVHAAGLSDNYHPQDAVWRVNVGGVASAIDAAQRSKGGYLIHISSASVYGLVKGTFVASESRSLSPLGTYAESKAEGERIVREALLEARVRGLVFRPFTVVGPGQRWFGGPAPVLVGMVRAALEGRDFTIQPPGTQLRDYFSVSDVAEAVIRTTNARLNSPVPVNLGSGRGTSVLELASLVERATRRTMKRRLGDADHSAGSSFISDNARMSGLLGLAPEPLESVVQRTADWLQNPSALRLRIH